MTTQNSPFGNITFKRSITIFEQQAVLNFEPLGMVTRVSTPKGFRWTAEGIPARVFQTRLEAATAMASKRFWNRKHSVDSYTTYR